MNLRITKGKTLLVQLIEELVPSESVIGWAGEPMGRYALTSLLQTIRQLTCELSVGFS